MFKVIYTMNQNIYMLNPKLLKLFNFNRRQVCSFHISRYILFMNQLGALTGPEHARRDADGEVELQVQPASENQVENGDGVDGDGVTGQNLVVGSGLIDNDEAYDASY